MENRIALVALFAALIAALGLVPKLTLAFGVPITAQTLGVMLCGTILGAGPGALASLLFIGLVALGLPLLAGGRGGLGLFFSPSAGFLLGWPVAALATGLLMQISSRMMDLTNKHTLMIVSTLSAVLGCIVVLYIPGIIGMSVTLDLTLWEAGVLSSAFVPGDMIKAVIAGLITTFLARARPDSVLSIRSQSVR